MRVAIPATIACLLTLVAAPFCRAGITTRAKARGCIRTVGPGADLQAALDALAGRAGHVTLCLRPGTYTLPRLVAIERSGITLRGAGDATVLRLRDGVQAPIIVVGDFRHQVPARATTDVTIERMRLVGNGEAGSEFLPDHPYLSNSAVVVRGGRWIALRALDVSACRSACLLTEHETRDVVIERNRIRGSTWDGVSLNRTARLRLAGNTIRDNRAAGITVEHLEDSVISRNVVAGNGSHGVYLADAYRNRFERNRFLDNVNAGVFLTCSVRFRDPDPVRCWDDSMSAANRFEANVFAGNRRDFIVAGDAAARCTRRGFVPNLSRGDRFRQAPRIDQPAWLGRCLEQAPAGRQRTRTGGAGA
jgi:parallel beta-helix repeat protein